jgi:hypothetical protein
MLDLKYRLPVVAHNPLTRDGCTTQKQELSSKAVNNDGQAIASSFTNTSEGSGASALCGEPGGGGEAVAITLGLTQFGDIALLGDSAE